MELESESVSETIILSAVMVLLVLEDLAVLPVGRVDVLLSVLLGVDADFFVDDDDDDDDVLVPVMDGDVGLG